MWIFVIFSYFCPLTTKIFYFCPPPLSSNWRTFHTPLLNWKCAKLKIAFSMRKCQLTFTICSLHSFEMLQLNAPPAPQLLASKSPSTNFNSNEAMCVQWLDWRGWWTDYCQTFPLCFKFPFSPWLIPSTLNKMFSFCPMSCWELE